MNEKWGLCKAFPVDITKEYLVKVKTNGIHVVEVSFDDEYADNAFNEIKNWVIQTLEDDGELVEDIKILEISKYDPTTGKHLKCQIEP